MILKGCVWIILGAITITILISLAFLLIRHKKDWCNLAINAGDCEFNEEDEHCYCIDTFKYKNVTDQNNIYDSSRAQCQAFNGNLAATDENELTKWLGKRMFFMRAENAVVALRKLTSKWYWIKDKNEEAVDIMWRSQFPPNPEHEQGILTVETVKENIGDDEYIYYNYDHYIDSDDLSYQWHGFSTINESFTHYAYYICKYDSDSGLISSKDTDGSIIILAQHEAKEIAHPCF